MPALRSTAPLRARLAEALPDRPFTVTFWDGSSLPSTNGGGGPTFTATSPRALAHLLRAPGQLGLGRAYADGSLQVDDIDLVLPVLDGWDPPSIDTPTKAKLALAAVRATGPVRPPRRPTAELVPKGRRHSRERDARAVRHHYDVSNDYFRLFLGPSWVYSCAIFSRGATTLEEAQEAKLDLVCTKLGLTEGQRILDVGCGWGSFALHAAERYGVHVTGITLSPPQAELAQRRAREAGLEDRIDIRVQDYRDLAGSTFDAISSIGMVEHVGDVQIDAYARTLAGLLAPGGRLLNHGIARLRHGDPEAGDFSERFVFPDAAPLHLSRVLLALERAGFETEHTEGFRMDYAETLTHWAANFDANLDRAIALGGAERARVWRLYLRAARHGFESGFTSVYQALVTKR
jgi:cyclopropane-fatty-acyl-phospholipid synthase